MLPQSLQVSSEQIAHLDRAYFFGKSFAPEPAGSDLDGRPSPFGTLIEPSAPPASAPTSEAKPRPDEPAPPPAAPRWRIEDD